MAGLSWRLLAAALVGSALGAGAVAVHRPPVGRYQVVMGADSLMVHRLDTATGELRLFIAGTTAPSGRTVDGLRYWPLTADAGDGR